MGEYVYTKVKQETTKGMKDFKVMEGKFTISFAAMLYDVEDMTQNLMLTTSIGKSLDKLKGYLSIIQDVQTLIAKRIEPVVQYFYDYLSNFSRNSILTSDCYCLTEEEIKKEVNDYKVVFEKMATKEITESKHTYEIVNEHNKHEYKDAIESEVFFKNELNLEHLFIDRLYKFKNMQFTREFFFYVKNKTTSKSFLKDLKKYEQLFQNLDDCLCWEVEKGKYVVFTLFLSRVSRNK